MKIIGMSQFQMMIAHGIRKLFMRLQGLESLEPILGRMRKMRKRKESLSGVASVHHVSSISCMCHIYMMDFWLAL